MTVSRPRPPRCRKEVLSVVERGWRGARQCSLELQAMAVPVTHLIKGSLSADLLAMIRPYPGIRLVSIPRPLFPIWLWAVLVWRRMTGRLAWVVVDHARTLRRLTRWGRAFGLRPVLIHETEQSYELRLGDRPLPVAALSGADAS